MNRFCLAVPLAFLGPVVVTTTAHEETKRKAVSHLAAEVRFDDGSFVRITLLDEAVEVKTKFGKLDISFKEIHRIEFGLHMPVGSQEKIDDAIKKLGSDAYKEREDAAKSLIQLGRIGYPFVEKVANSNDMEVAKRAGAVLKKIREKVPPERLNQRTEDVIHTTLFPVVGRIISPSIKAHSPHFGELSLKLSDLRTMHVQHNGNNDLTIDSARYGSAADQWLNSQINVDPSLRVVITSKGQVDLWPQGPGQYLASPKGYTTAGRGGQFQAGALVGRIGEDGKPFFIGERKEFVPGEEGRLWLHIVPSPWNNESSGSFSVRVLAQYNVKNP